MVNEKDPNGYGSTSNSEAIDMGSKGGPSTTLGNPDDNHNISHPYSDDIQTQLAAKSVDQKKKAEEESKNK